MTVFVYGGHLPNGGARMAFEVGDVLREKTGQRLVVVAPGAAAGPSPNFEYPSIAAEVDHATLKAAASSGDTLIINPSFHDLLPGLWFPGRLLTFAQHFTTFDILDPHCRHFVSASSHIRDHIRRNFGIKSEVIPLFAPEQKLPTPIPWEQKEDRFLIGIKGVPESSIALLDHLYACGFNPDHMRSLLPGPRREVLAAINAHKWFLSFALTEGFGLMPLEAMALGSVFVGFDGYGSGEYLRDGWNGFVQPLEAMAELPKRLTEIMRAETTAIRENGFQTAASYNQTRFRREWSDWLDRNFLP